MKVVRDDLILAESNDTIVIEGNHYFPPEAVNWDYFQKSDSYCDFISTALHRRSKPPLSNTWRNGATAN